MTTLGKLAFYLGLTLTFLIGLYVHVDAADSTVYQLPNYDDQTVDYHYLKPFDTPPDIDSRELYSAVLDCYPATSILDNISVNLRLGRNQYNYENDDNFLADRSGNYAAIVAEMPLYSGTEKHRLAQQEYDRRTRVAKSVADFVASIIKLRHEHRMLTLYQSLEQRAQRRVQDGLTTIDEQVSYMEKVSKTYSNIELERTKQRETRLSLLAHCSRDSDRQRSLIREIDQLGSIR